MAAMEGTWIEYLSPEECWRMLSASLVGRIGVLVDSAPEVYPVNFVVDGDTIVFRTDPGSKLRGLDRSPAVCFEADGIDLEEHTGWSVLVKGRATEVTTPEDRRELVGLPLELWTLGEKAHWVRVRATEVSGRRIHRPAEEEEEEEEKVHGHLGSEHYVG